MPRFHQNGLVSIFYIIQPIKLTYKHGCLRLLTFYLVSVTAIMTKFDFRSRSSTVKYCKTLLHIEMNLTPIGALDH